MSTLPNPSKNLPRDRLDLFRQVAAPTCLSDGAAAHDALSLPPAPIFLEVQVEGATIGISSGVNGNLGEEIFRDDTYMTSAIILFHLSTKINSAQFSENLMHCIERTSNKY